MAYLLELVTDDYSQIGVSITDGVESWSKNFYDYKLDHSLPLLGFKADRVYEITVTVTDLAGSSIPPAGNMLLVTDPLPDDFAPMTVLQSKPGKMEPGYTLLRPIAFPSFRGYVSIVDNKGEVVWYSGRTSNFGVTRLENGNLLYPLLDTIQEVNMMGQVIRSWELPVGKRYHHEIFPTSRGTFLYLSEDWRDVEEFPTSLTDPDAPTETATLVLNPVRELSLETGEFINEWFPIDMLDPRRLTYLTFALRSAAGVDWSHANAVIEDPRDGCLIVSMRHQNAVIKFTRSGELKWILGAHENWTEEFQQYLLTPVGTEFEWNYAQHAPMVTPQGTILLYDNGNYRAAPPDPFTPNQDNYSRAVEYSIDEEAMTVSQVWEFGKDAPERLFTAAIGDANYLENTGNVLITFGGVTHLDGAPPDPRFPSAQMSRIIEVTRDASPEVVFDLSVFDYEDPGTPSGGYWVYRSHRIPDLYPVTEPAALLQDLISALGDNSLTSRNGLNASAAAVAASLQRGNPKAAVNQLGAFQNKLLAQVGRKDFDLAMHFYGRAQSIIDVLNDR